MRPSKLVETVGGAYAKELGIDLSLGKGDEIHKWFLAAILFGARISEKIAAKTYREFEHANVLAPRRILDAGKNTLVRLLDRGGYARYDFKTAAKLQDVSRSLMQQYKGSLNELHRRARDAQDLERRLKSLGKGIGGITVNIFLRELRGIWAKADPLPVDRTIQAAKALKFIPANMNDPAHILLTLKDAWEADQMRPEDFADFEAALVRYEAMSRRKSAV
jgi:hypothetical protein